MSGHHRQLEQEQLTPRNMAAHACHQLSDTAADKTTDSERITDSAIAAATASAPATPANPHTATPASPGTISTVDDDHVNNLSAKNVDLDQLFSFLTDILTTHVLDDITTQMSELADDIQEEVWRRLMTIMICRQFTS